LIDVSEKSSTGELIIIIMIIMIIMINVWFGVEAESQQNTERHSQNAFN
jgi:hypothetical protein